MKVTQRANDHPPTDQSRARRRPGREARPAQDRHRDRPEGAKAACERCGYLEGSQIAWNWDWHGAARREGASNELARGAMTSVPRLTQQFVTARLTPQLTNSLLRRA
jgi:hypothetical protein